MRGKLRVHIGRIFIYVISILMQLGWLLFQVWKLNNYYAFVSVATTVISVALVLYIINKWDNPAYKIAWLLCILVFPIFGVTIYIMFGHVYVSKKEKEKYNHIHDIYKRDLIQDEEIVESLNESDRHVAVQSQYIFRHSGYPAYVNTSTRYFQQGELLYEQMKKELAKAEHFIFIEYFSIQHGVFWDSILDILEEKAAAGVDVRVIYDDMGCIALLPKGYTKFLSEKKIKSFSFNKIRPFISVIMNNRDHRKIMVIDGMTAFTGGVNITDQYINEVSPYGHWKDAGLMIKGDAVWNFTMMFLEMWNANMHEDDNYDMFRPDFSQVTMNSRGCIQPFSDTPFDKENVGETVYMNIINRAKRYVYIYTPYFIIDNEMMNALCIASKNGIDIRIVTPAIPDKKMIYLLTQSYYEQLIDSGIRIYQYSLGFIHSKCILSDDEVAVIGTINFDFRSLYLHFECGAFMYNAEAVDELKADFVRTFRISEKIDREFCENRSLLTRILQSILRVFAPLL